MYTKLSHETTRAKKIIVEIVRQVGGQCYSKASLFKAFWKAHLWYADNAPGYLSNWPIIRTPSGPAIDDFDLVLSEMLRDGWLTVGDTQFENHQVIVLSLGVQAPPTSLPMPAVEAICEGIKSTGGQLKTSNGYESHLQSRVWRETKDGEEMDIYLDLISDDERARMETNFAVLWSALN